MGANPLSDKSIRRIARSTGLPVIYGYGWGGYWHAFVTEDHRHGVWHRTSHQWEWNNMTTVCSTSCRTRFPETMPPVPAADWNTHHTCLCEACAARRGLPVESEPELLSDTVRPVQSSDLTDALVRIATKKEN